MMNVLNKVKNGEFINIILIILQLQCQHYLLYLHLMDGVQFYGYHKIVERLQMVQIFISVKFQHISFIWHFALLDLCFSFNYSQVYYLSI